MQKFLYKSVTSIVQIRARLRIRRVGCVQVESFAGTTPKKPRVVVLDRFPESLIPQFFAAFRAKGVRVASATTLGNPSRATRNLGIKTFRDLDVIRGAHFEDVPWRIYREEIDFYSQYEGIFIEMLSRHCASGDAWRVHEMTYHFYQILNWAENLLLEAKPDFVWSSTVPHEASSFALYLSAKKLRVPTLYLDGMGLPGLALFSCSISHRTLLARNHGSERHPEPLESLLQKYSMLARESQSFTTELQAGWSTSPEGQMKMIRLLWRRSIEVFRSSEGGLLKRCRQVYIRATRRRPMPWLKFKPGKWDRGFSDAGYVRWWFFAARAVIRIKKIRKIYERLSLLRLSGPYILLALHFEPEGATLPTALFHRNQDLFIRKLLANLPPNLKLYVRAHPGTFHHHRGAAFNNYPSWRQPSYFEDLLNLGRGRIQLSSLKTPVHEVIDKAIGVATLCGTIGFEALSRGKRVINGVPTWYGETDGVYVCQTEREFQVAIGEMINSKKVIAPGFRFDGEAALVGRETELRLSPKEVKVIVEKALLAMTRFYAAPRQKWTA